MADSRQADPGSGTAQPALPLSSECWGRREWLVMLGLAAASLLTFSPVLRCGFLNYDDPNYVTDNPHVKGGLTREGLCWSLTTMHAGNWHPLVWWSFQADAQLYGLRAYGFHLTNLLWHTGSVLMLFAALRRMTGQTWPSALAAGLFAVHPLNVQAVAWVAERKGVLSTFFWVLTLWTYARYAEQPRLARYLLVLLAFVLGLIAKAMLVTLPVILLLLDYWPLRRWPAAPAGRLVAEKLALFLIAGVFTVLTFKAQADSEALRSINEFSLAARLKNVPISTCWYLGRVVWPTHLAIFYPHPGDGLSGWLAVGEASLLAVLTVLAVAGRRRAPAVFVGWLWYLIALVPVCGLIQLGRQARADRWSYVPLIGIFLAVAWGISAAARRWGHLRVVAAGCVSLLACLSATSWSYAHHWTDNLTVWNHALEVAEENDIALNARGVALLELGNRQEAIRHYRMALRLRPDNPHAHYNLVLALFDTGQTREMIPHCREFLRIKPDHRMVRYLLAAALKKQGQTAQAIAELREVLRIDPRYVAAHTDLGLIALGQGEATEAVAHFQAALRLDPANAILYGNLGLARAKQGDWRRAVACFRRATELAPGHPAYRRSYHDAVRHLEERSGRPARAD